MTWKDLLRRLNTAMERHPGNLNDTAMCRVGDVLYEVDLFRSLSSGRLHISPAYPERPVEEDYFDDEGSEVVVEEGGEEAPTAPEPPEEEREPVDVHPTSFSRPKS